MTLPPFKRTNASTRLIPLGLAVMVAACLLLFVTSGICMMQGLRSQTNRELAHDIQIGTRLAAQHPEDAAWDRELQGLVDDEVAIYVGDRAVAATAFRGERLIGEVLPPALRQSVWGQEAQVDQISRIGRFYYVVRLAPLRDGGRVVGMVVAALPLAAVLHAVMVTGISGALAALGVMGLLGWCFVRLGRHMTRADEITHAELQRANMIFQLVIDNMSEGVGVFDPSGRLMTTNERFSVVSKVSHGTFKRGMTLLEVLLAGGAVQNDEMDEATIRKFAADRVRDLQKGIGIRVNLRGLNGTAMTATEVPIPGGGWLAILEDLTEHNQVQAQIDFMKHYDSATHLPNGEKFLQLAQSRLDSLEADTTQAEWPELLKIGIARFNEMHDSLGQDLSDTLLNEIKFRMQSCLRDGDVIARISTDEFAVMPDKSFGHDGVCDLAQRLLTRINGRYDLSGHSLSVSASIGAATAPEHGTDAHQLLNNASIAMRLAQTQPESWCVFDRAMENALLRRLGMEAELGAALADGQFEILYQPLINLKLNRISCCEALLRWRHPVRGVVSPTDFIPIAEETGIIVPLGAWVVRRACQDAASWPCGIRVAVNLSAIQVRDPSIITTIKAALDESGLLPSRLELEVTETVMLEGDHGAMLVLHELRAMGVRISMDDFGTGHSSLSYLRDFPFNKIKIDKSFVQQMLVRDDCLAIVRAVTGLACSLGMAVTAEGAESLAQVERLRMIGCTEVQGFHYSKPRPLVELWHMFEQDFKELV